MMRNVLLWASENHSMREKVPQMVFVKKALKKFMPGEDVSDAINATEDLSHSEIPTVFTHLGENLTNLAEAEEVTRHYLNAVDKISESGFDVEISLKLTQLGLDLSYDRTLENFAKILDKAKALNNIVWIDMEGSSYVDTTLRFYKNTMEKYQNAGLCLQAYLFRTKNDLDGLLKLKPNIRLVKGAYNESEKIAFKNKSDVDKNYFKLSKLLLNKIREDNIRAVFGTHDQILIQNIREQAVKINLPKDKIEIQMLYGIKPCLQKELARDIILRVLISYGEFWYPWYMRRLAERPANVMFVLKNIFSK